MRILIIGRKLHPVAGNESVNDSLRGRSTRNFSETAIKVFCFDFNLHCSRSFILLPAT